MTTQHIIFINHVVDGVKKVYVEREWPNEMLCTDEFIRDAAPGGMVAFDGEQLTLSVLNGRAIYKMEPADAAGFRSGKLVVGTFEPAPAFVA